MASPAPTPTIGAQQCSNGCQIVVFALATVAGVVLVGAFVFWLSRFLRSNKDKGTAASRSEQDRSEQPPSNWRPRLLRLAPWRADSKRRDSLQSLEDQVDDPRPPSVAYPMPALPWASTDRLLPVYAVPQYPEPSSHPNTRFERRQAFCPPPPAYAPVQDQGVGSIPRAPAPWPPK
ncbi:hypothetical protein H4R21_003110 [Coemansia helicoidea]|uniref:Uncharacterized protein n=1 Tax=Coemansia helicoidea TaxID=1286919 RepID=A0ACC1L3E1_9FUNG|nr:hypothetical protein H4R21_003110 [Coemansia helicoidea]